MSVIEKIIDSAEADTDVLRRLDQDGDNFSKFREVDFHFRCETEEKAKTVAGFIEDFQFGKASFEFDDGEHYVNAVINMPVTQQVALCVSGFMTCLAELYGVEFDGWGCVAQNGS
ncbi:ribonuclease E inhibitor RraB [Aliikangiella sp. IMCC44653]